MGAGAGGGGWGRECRKGSGGGVRPGPKWGTVMYENVNLSRSTKERKLQSKHGGNHNGGKHHVETTCLV